MKLVNEQKFKIYSDNIHNNDTMKVPFFLKGKPYLFLYRKGTHMKKSTNLKKLVCSALFLALTLLLPLVFCQIKAMGIAFSPMHLPVLMCGFICGWPWGLAVGLIAPMLRFSMFHMPELLTALTMTFELAGYGFAAGLLYKLLPKKFGFLYVNLIISMILGRLISAVASMVICGLRGVPFGFITVLAGSFVSSLPGIACQIILIPPIVLALKKARLTLND